jgi:hypothetical protein
MRRSELRCLAGTPRRSHLKGSLRWTRNFT